MTTEGETTTALGRTSEGATNVSERVGALGALYAAERQDAATFVTARLALLALQLTYISLGTVALRNGAADVSPWVAAFSGFPLWFMHAYHVILVAMSIARVESATAVEDALYEATGLPAAARDRIGVRAGQRLADLAQQPAPLKVQALVSYGGIGLIMLAFSGYGLSVAADPDGWASPPVLLAGGLHLLFTVTAAVAWHYVTTLSLPATD